LCQNATVGLLVRNRYRIVERLGAGGMGTVWAVEDALSGARVALKALWPEADGGPMVASLRAEFGLLAALRDPLLCRVHDFGRLPRGLELPGAPAGASSREGLFYTRELVAGDDLADAAAGAGRSLVAVCRWMASAARGLDALHRAGLRHGDFKPKNAIAVAGGAGLVRLIDFGLASGETDSRAAGTLAYMAPEVLERRPVDRRADLYALGISLYQLLSGALPSGARTGSEIVAWHLAGPRPSLAATRTGAPPALVELVARLIARDPEDRLPSAAEAAAALSAAGDAARDDEADAEAGTARDDKPDEPGVAMASGSARSRAGASAAGASAAGASAAGGGAGAAGRPGDGELVGGEAGGGPVFPPVGAACVAALERAFERRCEGRGGPAMVELEGAPGSGKSTILTELAWRAQLGGAEVVRGEARSGGHALGALGAALAQIEALRGGDAAGLAARLAARLAGEGGPGHVAHGVAGALAEAARAWPVLILLDDFDFADEGSRALAPAVALALPDEARVLLVAARSSGGAAPGDWPPAGEPERLSVPPLGPAEVEEIVRRAAGRCDERLAAWLSRQTGGNLLHLVHAVRALAARGFPAAEALAGLDLPPRLEEWERAQLVAAGRDPAAACEALAVLADPAEPALVAAVAGDRLARESAAAAALARAAERGLVRADPRGRFRMARPATAQALVGALDPARRAELHRRAAAALASAAPAPEPAALLRHRVRAGDAPAVRGTALPVLGQLRRAGDHAGALALGAAALDLVTRAAAAAGRPSGDGVRGVGSQAGVQVRQAGVVLVGAPPRGSDARVDGAATALRLEVGELAQLCGDLARADQALGPLVEGDAAPAAVRQRAQLALARACDGAGEPERAERLFRAAIAGPADAEPAASAARDLAAHYIRHGRAADALAVAEAALAAPGDTPARARIRGHLLAARAFARGTLGSAGPAAAELEQVAADAAQAGDPGLVAAALHFAARLAFSAGDYRRARAHYRAALAAAESVGELPRAATLRMNLAAMEHSSGEFAAALAHYASALSLFRAAGLATNAVLARRNLGHLLLELGEVEQARAELGAAAIAAGRLGLVVHEIGIEALLGIADWRSGHPGGGRRRLERARARFAELGDARRESETLLDLADLELDAAEGEADPAAHLEQAAAHLAAAARIPATREDTARRARSLALSADCAARQGDAAAARAHLEALRAPLAELEAQGGRQLEWDLRRIAARAAERIGDAAGAAEHHGRASSLLDEMAARLSESRRLSFWHDPRRRRLRRAAPLAPSLGPVADPLRSTVTAPSSEQMVDKLFRLLAIYRRLSTELDLDRLLELAMETAIELSGCDRGFLVLADPSGALRTAVSRNLAPAELATLAPAGPAPPPLGPAAASPETDGQAPYSRSIAERVFATGEVVVTSDARMDPRFARAESVHALHVGRVVCAPIHARGRVAGVLYLESRAGVGPIGADDLRLLMAFGDQAAVVLDSARLMAENARRSEELERARGEIEALLAERTALLEQRTEELASARRDLESVHRRFLGGRGAFGIVGRSPAMERVFEMIDRAAAADVPVLVIGESGTGKELVARALHQYGPRGAHPMVSVNCGALPEPLLESELFGHVRGAFTGADRPRRGLFEAADRGTLFLDEVGDTPPRMQAGLLRALQEGVIRPVGGTRDVRVDVRVVAAAQRPLEELVAGGRMREDLFYRLHVVAIPIPPLRERREDIPLLVEHVLAGIAERGGGARRALTRRALRALCEQPWPGNVRQLEHALTQACVMAEGEAIDLPELTHLLGGASGQPARGRAVEDRRSRERKRILDALERSGWNRSRAAEELGMPRRTFYRRLAEYDIQ
jgi:transcriptional regulator with GAF, ATPase, and Fis domain